MPVKPEMLNDPQQRNIIANKLLTHERLRRVKNDYYGYTCRVKIHPNGRLEKVIEQPALKR